MIVLLGLFVAMASSCSVSGRQDLPAPPVGFVAVFEFDPVAPGGAVEVQTIESDGHGHVRWMQKPGLWRYMDYNDQTSFDVSDAQKMFYKEPGRLPGVFLVDPPPAVLGASPELHGETSLVALEDADGHVSQHYSGHFQSPGKEKQTKFDIWFSAALHCVVRTAGLGRDVHLVRYTPQNDLVVEIPKSYRKVDLATFDKTATPLPAGKPVKAG